MVDKKKKRAIKTKREFYQLDPKKPLVGIFVGIIEGKFGGLIVFNRLDSQEQIVMPNYTVLHDVPFEEGIEYEVNYLGEQKNKDGTKYHDFTVFAVE